MYCLSKEQCPAESASLFSVIEKEAHVAPVTHYTALTVPWWQLCKLFKGPSGYNLKISAWIYACVGISLAHCSISPASVKPINTVIRRAQFM